MAQKNEKSQKEQQNKLLSELGKSLSIDSTKPVQDMAKDRQGSLNTGQNIPQKSFSQNLDSLINISREQQLANEQEIQNTLNQVSTGLMDGQRLKNLYNYALELQAATELGTSHLQTNAKNYFKIINQMENECHKQQIAMDMQVIQTMQKAVIALAQAQTTLLASQSLEEMFDTILVCRENLAEIQDQQKS